MIGTQILASVIVLTGFLMQPIGWNLGGLAWVWAIVECLLLDPIKRVTYRILEQRGLAAGEIK